MAPAKKPNPCRLTDEQVLAQLRRARQAFDRFPDQPFVAGSLKLVSEFAQLGLVTFEDQVEALDTVLRELTAQCEVGSFDCYCGPHPPNHLSGEPRCKGARMVEFVWHSPRFRGRKTCFKFCMSGHPADERFVVLSLHEDYQPSYFQKKDRR